MTETFIKERKHNLTGKVEKVGIDDACALLCHFENGSLGLFESTRYARGHKALYTFEINGEKASIKWDLHDLHRLEYFDHRDEGKLRGWRSIHVTDAGGDHPYMSQMVGARFGRSATSTASSTRSPTSWRASARASPPSPISATRTTRSWCWTRSSIRRSATSGLRWRAGEAVLVLRNCRTYRLTASEGSVYFTDVLRIAARFVGGLLALYAVVLIPFAHLFHTREWEACKDTLLGDVVLGAAAGAPSSCCSRPTNYAVPQKRGLLPQA